MSLRGAYDSPCLLSFRCTTENVLLLIRKSGISKDRSGWTVGKLRAIDRLDRCRSGGSRRLPQVTAARDVTLLRVK